MMKMSRKGESRVELGVRGEREDMTPLPYRKSRRDGETGKAGATERMSASLDGKVGNGGFRAVQNFDAWRKQRDRSLVLLLLLLC